MDAIPLIGPLFGFFGKLAELSTWARLFDLATGEAFYASIAVGIVIVLVMALWRLPKIGGIDLDGFTGKVALVVVVGLVALLVFAFLVVVYVREVKPALRDDAEASAHPAGAQHATPHSAAQPSRPLNLN